MPAQRFLDRLVDDAHAAAADFAEDVEFSQLLRHGAVLGSEEGPRRQVVFRAEFLHHDHRGEQLADFVRQLRVFFGVLRQRRPFTAAIACGKLLGQFFDWLPMGGRVVHGHSSPMPPGMFMRISLSRRRART